VSTREVLRGNGTAGVLANLASSIIVIPVIVIAVAIIAARIAAIAPPIGLSGTVTVAAIVAVATIVTVTTIVSVTGSVITAINHTARQGYEGRYCAERYP
jgi:hypothetical protein